MVAVRDDESQGLVRDEVLAYRGKNSCIPRWTRRSWRMAFGVLAVVFLISMGVLVMWRGVASETETANISDEFDITYRDPSQDLPFVRDKDPLIDVVLRAELSPSTSSNTTEGTQGFTEKKENENEETISPVTTSNNSSTIDYDKEDLKNALFSTKLQVEECRKLKQRKSFADKNSFEYKLASANCGWDYSFADPPSKTEPWRVVLFGHHWNKMVLYISGCPIGETKCPSAPMCNITLSNDVRTVSHADVIVAFQEDADASLERLKDYPKLKRQYRVLYFREAHTKHPSALRQEMYEFEMGVHFYAELYNPTYMRRPSELLSGSIFPFPPIPMIPLQEKTKFAMWAISDCHAISQRDLYIARMTRVLGADRVHGYGKCGNRMLPQKPINNAAKLIAEYKFYLSFENMIENGYVSEKLLWILTIPVVPVYYGAPNVPNITTVPSYINVANFRNPEALAQYLLHLDGKPEEYNKYHVWRDKSGKYFTEEYLDAIRYKLAGPEEVLQFSNDAFAPQRSAQCCRLCDKRYVQWAVHQRLINKKRGTSRVTDMTKSHLMTKFFGG